MIARAFALGALIALLAIAPAIGLEIKGNTIIFSQEEMAECRAEGFCRVWTNNAIRYMEEAAREKGRAECRAGNRT